MAALLKQLYFNPKFGYESDTKLYHKAHDIDNKITLEDVDEFLGEETAPQITKPLNKEKEFDTVESPSVRNNYQCDIMYLPSPTFNNSHKYLLTCIDVYSRYVFVKSLTNREGDTLFTAFKEMMDENGIPKNLNVDFECKILSQILLHSKHLAHFEYTLANVYRLNLKLIVLPLAYRFSFP